MRASRGSTNSGSIAEDEPPCVWQRNEEERGSLCAPSPRLAALIPGCKNKVLLHERQASCKRRAWTLALAPQWLFPALGHSDCRQHPCFQRREELTGRVPAMRNCLCTSLLETFGRCFNLPHPDVSLDSNDPAFLLNLRK